MNKHKILLIKTGYSETLDRKVSPNSSLGDVLRTTAILHLFRDDHVTWLVDEHAYPLLYGNPYIHRVLIYNLTSALQLQSERFDTVVNFEKAPGLCALSDSIHAWRRFGFRFDEMLGSAQAYDNAEEVIAISLCSDKKKSHNKIWQEALFQMLGATWNKEEYILGYRPETKPEFDLGLNWAVGKAYPTKAWPKQYWDELRHLAQPKFSCSMQQGLDNMYNYIDWINSCRILITNDSLGLHLAIALKKKILVLYGPTHASEVWLYGLGKAITTKNRFDCMPCFQADCMNDKFCMEFIKPEEVMEEIVRMTDDREFLQK